MKLIVTIEKKHKIRNTMAAAIIDYAQSQEVKEADSLEWARDKILAQIIYMRQRKMARGKVTVGKPYVSARIIGSNRGRMAFGVIQPGRRSWSVQVMETEDRELPAEIH